MHVDVDMDVEVVTVRSKDDMNLSNYGFIHPNLCMNDQIREEHTECDTLYRIIFVQNQLSKIT